jgi:hypothetical protein
MRIIILAFLVASIGLVSFLDSADAFRRGADNELTRDQAGNAMPVLRYSGTAQNVTVSGTSAATTNAVSVNTHFVRIICTGDSWMTVAAVPVATTGDMYLALDVETVMRVVPGTDKLAFIQDSGAGTCNVAEMR